MRFKVKENNDFIFKLAENNQYTDLRFIYELPYD